jgi:hypothetical protein
MKLQKIFYCLFIIVILYIFDNDQLYNLIIDHENSYEIIYNNNFIKFDKNVKLKINDSITNNIKTYKIIEIIDDNSAVVNENIVGNNLFFINVKKNKIPKNIKEIHTIYINDKMIPEKIYIKQFSIVKWKNQQNNIDKIICTDSKSNKIIFSSKELSLNDIDFFTFDKKATYNYYRNNDIYNINTINVI